MDAEPERRLDVADLTSSSVSVSESERLKFAKQILLGLALLCTSAMVGYACYPENRALAQVFELGEDRSISLGYPRHLVLLHQRLQEVSVPSHCFFSTSLNCVTHLSLRYISLKAS